MKCKVFAVLVVALAVGALVMACLPMMGPSPSSVSSSARAQGGSGGGKGGGGGGGETETAVNNLSFPVIWADTPIANIGTRFAGVSQIEGVYVYVDEDAFDANGDPLVYEPDYTPLDTTWSRAYEQQDSLSVWTADAVNWADVPGKPAGETTLKVDWIDWGDNLESVDWTTHSQVRTEVVLFKDLLNDDNTPYLDSTGQPTELASYPMLHVRNLGIDEMWGLKTTFEKPAVDAIATLGVSQPIVYSNFARLTIQKLNAPRDLAEYALGSTAVVWDAGAHVWKDTTGVDLINETPIFNSAVYESTADGPSAYSAEVNIKGRVVYGYTWNTAADGVAEGDYRLTFSIDGGTGAGADLTGAKIVPPLVETTAVVPSAEESNDTGGASPMVSSTDNLTYIDIHLRAGGGSGKGGKQ